jgi:hypothetical protein
MAGAFVPFPQKHMQDEPEIRTFRRTSLTSAFEEAVPRQKDIDPCTTVARFAATDGPKVNKELKRRNIEKEAAVAALAEKLRQAPHTPRFVSRSQRPVNWR